MKKNKIFISVILLIILQGVLCFFLLNRSRPKVDLVALNQLLQTQTASGKWALHPSQIETQIAIVSDDGKTLYLDNTTQKEHTKEFVIVIGIISLLEVMILYWYFHYLEQLVFTPFQKLQNFAGRVAGGNLDLPLTMERDNIFGAFTESFDLMRCELKKSKQKEQEANQSKKELVAKLSHDIKTPIASIQAVAELMQISVTDSEEQQQLSIIRKKASQIDQLISDLFQATLEELEELTVASTEQSSMLLTEMLMAADYQQKADLDTIPECILVYDKLRLQQVFDNVFMNSYKYAQTHMKVTSFFEEAALVIAIEDFGPGVKEDELPLLFEKFYRGTNVAQKSGAGLGLFISRYLMTQMGGKIFCENRKSGFCVKIYLRLAAES